MRLGVKISNLFQLVKCFFVWSNSPMRWIPLDRLKGNAPGLYAIYVDGQLKYIGMSKTIKSRLRSHNIRQHSGMVTARGCCGSRVAVKVKYLNCRESRSLLESKLIRRLRPALNVAGNPGYKVIKCRQK